MRLIHSFFFGPLLFWVGCYKLSHWGWIKYFVWFHAGFAQILPYFFYWFLLLYVRTGSGVQEVMEGDPLRFTYRIVDCDEKRFHYWQEMYHAEKGYLAAQAEAITLHIDMKVRKVSPFPPEIYERIRAIYEAHKHLPLPENLGRQIQVRRK